MDIIEYQKNLLTTRFTRSKPEWVKHSDCIEIKSSNGVSCFVDLCDEDLAHYSWHCSKFNYFTRSTSRRHSTEPNRIIYLAPLILERMLGRRLERGEHCDHINWDRLNNRRINLRLATKSENAYNVRPHKDSRYSKHKGVAQSANNFRVQIQYSISVSESGFKTADEAARRYDELAAIHHGKFAVFNFPNEWVYDLKESRYVKVDLLSLGEAA